MGDPPSIEPYGYKDPKNGEIRILHLQPGNEDDSDFISISSEKLDREMMRNEKPKYKALSWQWGTRKADEYVRVKDRDSEGLSIFKLGVKSNLLNALTAFDSVKRRYDSGSMPFALTNPKGSPMTPRRKAIKCP
jgi:hypothetical protein